MMFKALGWLRNAVDFPLRQAIRWRRSGCTLPAEEKTGLYPPEAMAEVDRLVRTYGLERWQRESGRRDFAASLFYLQMLERALTGAGVALPPAVSALDAGCGDWFYVQPLYGLLRHFGPGAPRTVALDGVELDAYQMYAGLHSRHDWAEAFSAGLPQVRYLAQDIRRYAQPVDLAFMLFPFLFGADLRRWGLPRRYLRPADLLAHVHGLVKPRGWLVIANLGPAEREEQHRLLKEARLEIAWWGAHRSDLFQYREERYVTVIAGQGSLTV